MESTRRAVEEVKATGGGGGAFLGGFLGALGL